MGGREARRTEPLKIVPVARPAADAARGSAAPSGAAAPAVPAAAGIFIELEIAGRRAATLDELRFAAVNAWRRLGPFDQALLVEPGMGGTWGVTLASGVIVVDRNAPLIQAADAWLRHPRQADRRWAEARVVDRAQDHVVWGLEGEPAVLRHMLWLPLTSRDGDVVAVVMLLRQLPWQAHEQALYMPLADAYAHAWCALAPRVGPAARVRRVMTNRRMAIGIAALVLAAALVPVPMSSLAPAEVVAADPAVITAPVDGVIADILVAPGTRVEKSQIVARLVDVKARNDAEIAARNAAVASARYFRVVQSATSNLKDAHELATTKAEWELAKAELAYASDVLARSQIRAERSGILIYSAKSDWIGRPVATGERIMEIGDPDRIEVRVDLPVSDAIVLLPGNRMALFLDGDPLSGIHGHITRTSYRPMLAADQQLVYRIFASLDGEARSEARQRIGLRGTARVSGDNVALGFYLFRRPIAALRQRLGL